MSLREENKQMSMLVPNPEEYVRGDHVYRSFKKLIDFEKLTKPLESCYSNLGRSGYPVSSAFKSLLLQYLHDLSDRQLEEHIRDSLAARYFCGFSLDEQTPDHSYFSKFRERIGTKRLADLFNQVRSGLKKKGYIREIFTFVDASKLEACVDHWKARDKAIEDENNDETDDKGNPTMNNKNVVQYSSDPEARFGSKGKNDIWLGYKRHTSVDMRYGLISKVAITSANIGDDKALKHVCPNTGAVVADKAYCSAAAQLEIKRKGCHSQAILKRNMKAKNRDKDKFLTKLRMPYEGVFSNMAKRARYRGGRKLQFQAFMEAFIFNLKKLVNIGAEPVPLIT